MDTPDQSKLDGAGLVISLVCLLHCLALPVLIAFVPAAGLWLAPLDDHEVHIWLLVVAAPVSLAALTLGGRRHRLRRWLALGCLGLTGMLLGVLPIAGGDFERVVTTVGVALLGIAHLGNWTRLHRLRAHA